MPSDLDRKISGRPACMTVWWSPRGRPIRSARPAAGSLRDGLERILRGSSGALVVLGHEKVVESICTAASGAAITWTFGFLTTLAALIGLVALGAVLRCEDLDRAES